MRWKYFFSGLAVCLLIAALWYAWGSGLFAGKREPARLVAKDALLFVEQKRIGELIDGFNASRLGKSLAAIDIGKAAAVAGLNGEQTARLEQSVETAGELAENPVIRKFCDDSLSLAFFRGTTEATITNQKRQLPLQMLLIARPKQKAELLEILSSAFTADIKQKTMQYGDKEITQFSGDGTTFYATLANGFFLFAFDQQTLQNSLDCSGKIEQSLAGLSEYQTLKQQYQEDIDFFMFTSPEAIERELIRDRQQEWPTGAMAGLRYSSYGVWHDKDQFRDRSITLVDRKTLPAVNSWVFANPPQKNESLAMVPADIQFYYWSNTLALRFLLDLLKTEGTGNSQQYDDVASGFKEMTGHDIGQIAASIGDGVSIQMRRGGPDAVIPVPSATVFFPVKDRGAVEDAISRGMSGLGLVTRDQKYRDRTFRSCSLGLPGDTEILYGFIDDYLFFGSSRQMLESIIDTMEKGNGLSKSPGFAALAAEFDKPNNSVTYIRVSEVISDIREIAGWAGAMLAMQDGELAAKSQVLTDALLNPLFDGISMISTIGTRTYTDADRIVMESIYTIVPDQNQAKKQ
jgi:hypothetical protein